MSIERKLAAIMFTDIAGYTEQMSQDEDKAFALIQKKRELLLPLIEKHEGKLIKEIGDKLGMGKTLGRIGIEHANKGEYDKAVEPLEKSLSTQKDIGFKELELETTTYLYLSYKHLDKDYYEQHLHSLIKDAENIEFEVNFRLYQLLDDTSYLESAYNQVQENSSKMEEKLGKNFLNYPIPKQIVDVYKKLNKDNN